jgi:hypothetical protein
MLVGGNRSKLPPPSWPKFNDSYRSYFAFKDELEAFIRDYGKGTSDRTLAQQIKANCLSKNLAAYVEWAWSPPAILETLGGLLGRPSRLVESLLEPVKKQKRIQMDDNPALLAYLTVVRNILQEIKRLGQMQLFNTLANIDMIVEKMPINEIEKWMEETEGMWDSQLASALQKFVLERWRHCGTIVARTTTAEQALKAGGVSQQHQHQQSGGKPSSPNSRRKNKQPFKKPGGGPPNQVPAGQAVQGTQTAQPGGSQQEAVVAASAAAGKQQQGATNNNNFKNQNQKWQPAQAAPAAAGRPAAQSTGFKCRVPGSSNQDRHFLPECLVFRSMTVSDRWSLVNNQNFCELCLKHFKSGAFSCNLAKAAGGLPPCGDSGCTLFHHPALHVQRTGLTGIHGAVYTTLKKDGKKDNMVSITDYSREPE